MVSILVANLMVHAEYGAPTMIIVLILSSSSSKNPALLSGAHVHPILGIRIYLLGTFSVSM